LWLIETDYIRGFEPGETGKERAFSVKGEGFAFSVEKPASL